MGIYTHVTGLNANHPSMPDRLAKLKKAEEDPSADTEDTFYEYFEGNPPSEPIGVEVSYTEVDKAVTQTDDEYGGWVIDLSKLPEEVTHVYISRG